MGNELEIPLADIISRMASTEVVGEAAKIKARFRDASGAVVVLCDVSGSMMDLIGHSGLSKYDHLKIALDDVLSGWPKIVLVAFASSAKRLRSAKDLPDPQIGALGGGTDLGRALRQVANMKPSKTIVISDGCPDNEHSALAEAEGLTGSIDTIYCGPDSHPAVRFLQKLSRSTGGVQVTWDGYRQVSSVIRGLLPAPGAE